MRGVSVIARLQGVADENENNAQKVTPGPADGAAGLGPGGERDLNHPLEGDGHEAKASGAEEGEDEVRSQCGAGGRCPDKGYEAGCGNGNEDLDEGEMFPRAVDEWGRNRGGDEAGNDEEGAGDA